MCGRYLRKGDKQKIAEEFHVRDVPASLVVVPDDNVAPTTTQPVIRLSREREEREIVLMRWGLIPFFAKSAKQFKAFSTINARAESVEERALWRAPLERRRCIVPADGFYEWEKLDAKAKKPFVYTLKSGEILGFAGLWDAWKDPANGEWLQTFAIITTTANELTSAVHDRMPVILNPRDYDRWLARGEVERLPTDLLRPFDAEAMQAREAALPKKQKAASDSRTAELW